MAAKEEVRAKCLGQGEYKPWSAYGATKLANLLFTHELQRLSAKNNWGIDAMAAHPGWSNTNLQNVSPQMREANAEARVTSAMNDLFAQSAHIAVALPVLAAATYSPLSGWFLYWTRWIYGDARISKVDPGIISFI